MRVVDASVVLKWLLEVSPGESRNILEQHVAGEDVLVAPELLNYEIGNVLATKVPLLAQQARELFGYFLDLDIQTYSLGDSEYIASLELARKYKLTAYDASYLVLALTLKTGLITADHKLATRAVSLGIIQRV